MLAAFDAARTVDWFRSLGVELKREETGKLFPVTDRARTVVDALVARCRALGVDVLTGCRVESIAAPEGEGFRIAYSGGELPARRAIVATGGRSLPRTGSDGFGYRLVRALGHTVTPTHPALVPLVLGREFFHAELRGVSHPAELSLWVDGKRADRRSGDLLWTHFGVSGPVVLDASRHWVIARGGGARVELKVGFLPGVREKTYRARSSRSRPRARASRSHARSPVAFPSGSPPRSRGAPGSIPRRRWGSSSAALAAPSSRPSPSWSCPSREAAASTSPR